MRPYRPTSIVRPLMWRFPLVAILLVAGCGAKIGDACKSNIDCSPLGDVVDTGFGRYERTFAAHAPRGTTATITAVVDGVTLDAHPSVFFVDARADIGAPFAAAGGCALARSAPPLGALLLLIVTVGLAFLTKSLRRHNGRTLDG